VTEQETNPQLLTISRKRLWRTVGLSNVCSILPSKGSLVELKLHSCNLAAQPFRRANHRVPLTERASRHCCIARKQDKFASAPRDPPSAGGAATPRAVALRSAFSASNGPSQVFPRPTIASGPHWQEDFLPREGGAVDSWERYSDRVAQASGMVAVQAACNLAAAIALMERLAADSDRALEEVAALVIEREIRFGD